MVTVARKIKDEYHYAIMNDTADIYEFPCSVTAGVETIHEVTFQRDRVVGPTASKIMYYECNQYANNTMYRFLDANHRVICNFELSEKYNIADWEYHASRYTSYSPHISPMGSDAKMALNQEEHVNYWAAKITKLSVEPETATRVPIIVVASSMIRVPALFFTVNIRISDVNHFEYSSGKFMISVVELWILKSRFHPVLISLRGG